jgi:hypothetical protein
MDSTLFLRNKSFDECGKCKASVKSILSLQKELWTTEYIIDRLFFEMLELEDNAEGWEDYQHKGQKQKYYNRAEEAIKMAAGDPPPVFVINRSDLSIRLRQELAGLIKSNTIDYVVSEATGRVCENVNAKLYHLTLKRGLGWRFEN